MTNLTAIETAALQMLLNGEHPILASLRVQLSSCIVKERKFTSTGFYTSLQVTDDAQRIPRLKLILGDVYGEISVLTYGATFVLFVEDGLLKTLEGASFEELWVDQAGSFRFQYMARHGLMPNGLRDLNTLNKDLEEALNKALAQK